MYFLAEIDWNNILESSQQFIMNEGPGWARKLGLALLVFFVGRIIARIIRGLVVRVMKRSDIEPSIQSFVGSLTYITLSLFVVIATLNVLGIQTTSFVAIIGAAGLAIGLALQGALSNFAAGFLVLIFKPYRIGDFIDGAGEKGTVSEIQLFTTTLKTPDNKVVIIPNSQITSGNITNYSKEQNRRVDIVVGIGYDDDIDKAKKAINDILSGHKSILKDPAPTVAISELGDSSVNIVVRPWVKKENYWPTYFELMETIKKRLDKENISIPFPQRDVHVYEHKVIDK